MKRTASVGAILHGHRPPKFRDRNVLATLMFGIFCVVVFEIFFLAFTARSMTSDTRDSSNSRRELPFVGGRYKKNSGGDASSSFSFSSNQCLPSIEAGAKPCPAAVPMQKFDALVVAVKPTCANKLALMSLRQYVNPRRIIVVTTKKAFCEKFKTAADGIECFHEDEFVDGVTKERTANAIAKFTKKKKKKTNESNDDDDDDDDDDNDGSFMGRSLSGWYLQQFIKMSAYKTKKLNPPLSKHYLVWDSDMILLRPMKLFDSKGRAVRAVGGNVVPSYKRTYERLMSGSTTGRKNDDGEIDNAVHYADDGTSFVAHQMLFDADVAEEMLSEFAKSNKRRNSKSSGSGSSGSIEEDDEDDRGLRLPPWGESIIREAYKEPENAHIGFSEYESYASFVSARHPELVKSLTLKNWARNPFFAGSIGVVVNKYVREDGLCCPTSKVLMPARWRNLAYVGFEIGHAEATCDVKSPKYANGYGW
jgi:hypothetical protein